MKKTTYILVLLLVFMLQPLLVLGHSSPEQAKKGEVYQIGIGDKINISVWQNQELKATVTVRPDGKISFFLLDDLYVLGLTPLELKKLLTERLEPHVSQPDVTVIIHQIDSLDVYVLGEVLKPGRYKLDKTLSLLHFLSLAGGVRESADYDEAFLLRNNQKLEIDFYQLLQKGNISQNINLQPYDIVYFPSKLDKDVTVFGEVKTPGPVPFRKGLTLIDAIVRVGGETIYANMEKIKILRANEILIVNFDKILKMDDLTANIELLPGDIIVVPQSLF